MTRRNAFGREIELQGPEPAGRTGYDRSGRMWVLLTPPIRSSETAVEEGRRDARGVIAYYGSYWVDGATRIVRHRVEAAIDRAWIGQVFERRYDFTGELLTLSFSDGQHSVRTVYRRLPDFAANDLNGGCHGR